MNTTSQYQNNRSVLHLLALSCLTVVLGLAGCEQEGPAEKAGKKIDRAGESAGQTVDKTAEKATKKIEDVQQSATQKIEGAKESAAQSMESAGGTVDDMAITDKVKAALLDDPALSASRIDVTTEQGVVKLSGIVDSEEAANKARALATAQPGVKSVQTDLSVTVAPGK
jgi:hyperosmotically inducible protein